MLEVTVVGSLLSCISPPPPQLADLSCLVFQKATGTYAPYDKDWIKEKIYTLLRKQAGK